MLIDFELTVPCRRLQQCGHNSVTTANLIFLNFLEMDPGTSFPQKIQSCPGALNPVMESQKSQMFETLALRNSVPSGTNLGIVGRNIRSVRHGVSQGRMRCFKSHDWIAAPDQPMESQSHGNSGKCVHVLHSLAHHRASPETAEIENIRKS